MQSIALPLESVGPRPTLWNGQIWCIDFPQEQEENESAEAEEQELDEHAYVLDWISREPLSREWFFEQRDGNCRLMGSFAVRLSETAQTWGC
ncbi:MAG TPA: hypothetical protein VNE63_00020 [Candidatus Acidoferrales bacterium]|nr:hypothetical protein [Candidatus Acidoferrales bacterium]